MPARTASATTTITSPSLIDFTIYQPRQTLLDRQDTYGFPPPAPVFEPYRDDFSESSEDTRSEGEREIEELLEVIPRPRKREIRRSSAGASGTLVKDSGGKGVADGCISITLPDGSNISFRPSASTVKGPSGGLARPVIAQGFEEALEAIKKLAVGNSRPTLPAPAKKAIQPQPKRNPPPPPHLLPAAVRITKPAQTKSPWPILPTLVQSSKLAPTAPSFQPRRIPTAKGHNVRLAVPLSPSTSPSPPLSNWTDNPPLVSSSQTTSPDRDPPPSGKDDSAIILTSPSAFKSLFSTDIKPIPWVKVDFPYSKRPSKKKKGGPTGVHVDQTKEEINKKVDDLLASLGIETPAPKPPVRKDIDQDLKKALAKVRETRQPLAPKKLYPVAPTWNPSATAFKPKSSSNLVDIDLDFTSKVETYDFPHQPTITIYDPPSPPKSIAMNGVSIDDWQGDVQDVNSYFDERDRLEKRNVGPSRVVSVSTAKLVDVSEFAQTIYKARTKVLPSALPSTPYDRLLSLPSARASVPRHSCASEDALQSTLMRSWIAAEPTDDQKRYFRDLASLLTRMVDQEWGPGAGARDQRFTVDIFGSVSWGGETGRGGDVDMVIRDSYYPQGYHPALWSTDEEEPVQRVRGRAVANIFRVDLSPVYDLHNVVYLLRRRGFEEVFGIYGATTPIAKFKDPTRPGVEVDVNVNDLGGWYNSRLILAYCEISPHVLRPLIHCLKLWAKVNHVNDPSGKYGMPTMSSYCLTLMAIGYLQHCGVLPNLQADVEVRIPDYPETEGKDVIWAGWGKATGTKINVGFAEHPKKDWVSSDPGMTAAEAVRGFFAHFSRTGNGRAFQYNTQVVSILNGGMLERARTQGEETQEAQARRAAGLAPLTREELMARETMMGKGDQGVQPRNWGERKLVVQDPFIWQKNCTQSMSKQGLDRWLSAVDRTHYSLCLHTDRCSLETLLANCLPPPPIQPPRHHSNGADNQNRISRDQMYRSGGGGGQRGVLPTRASPYGRTLFSPR